MAGRGGLCWCAGFDVVECTIPKTLWIASGSNLVAKDGSRSNGNLTRFNQENIRAQPLLLCL